MTKDANNGSALIKPFSLAVKLVFKIKPNLTFLSATKSHLNRNLIANIDRKFYKIIKKSLNDRNTFSWLSVV